MKVLVVDDVPDLVDLALLYLRRDKEVDASGVTSVDDIDWNNQPDAVLLDLMMPASTGLETAAKMRNLWPETKIIVWTAAAGPTALEAEQWADEVLSKPVDPDILLEVLRHGG